MKMIRFSKYVVLVIILTSVFGCDDAEMKAIDNGLYIQEAAPSNKFDQQMETQLIDEGEVVKTLTIRLVRAIEQDITVTLDIDQQLLDDYNQRNDANYQVLPEEFRSFEKEVTITAGDVSAPVVNLTIKPYTAPNGEAYAIPIRITSVEGPIEMKGNANHMLYLLTSPNKQKAVILQNSNTTQIRFKNEIPVDQWTIEYWLRVDNHNKWDLNGYVGLSNKWLRQYIYHDGSAPILFNQILPRYWADGVAQIAPTLQFHMDNPGFDMDSEEFWWPDIWYHIAYTYDGTQITLYKDGTKNVSKADTREHAFSSMTLAGGSFSYGGYSMQVEFAQIRLWKKCLTPTAIQDGMSRQISGNTDGLIGYWKCDEGSGKVLKDSSPNGNDITLDGTPKWSELYNFAHPND
ncbi:MULTISPECIES: BT_3987 domain-containing protein [Bacteroides]|uniref:BT_3987 domain-containing protein n=1 Tax=Bacteroides TaxID=816 RepID=UPI000820709A|nr:MULTISPECIES: DUF1735 domain-containing protein [Bacteroides]SCI16355.1 Domain of uncharacterised function (DUF1735) [uncultured Bacteroides sp.]